MRILLAGLLALTSAAQANTAVTCQAAGGEVRAVAQCGSDRYLVSYNFGDDAQGSYEAQLLTAGSSDYTFEEFATAGEGIATFFAYNTANGFVGEFGGKGVQPLTFAPGACVAVEETLACP